MIELVKTPEQGADYERIATAIRQIGDLGKRLNAAGLNRKAVILLIHDATNVPKRDIKLILDALPNLPRWYLAPKPETAKR
jgi:hypothetical protein